MSVVDKGEIKQFDYGLETLVLGLGSSGYSCVEFLAAKNCPFDICDTRKVPPNIERLKKEFPQQRIICEPITFELLKLYQQVVVSPGISIRQAAFRDYIALDRMLVGDVELFAQEINRINRIDGEKVKLIAITGSNGKSTVTTMVEHIARQVGVKALAGGNLGLPVLEMLKTDADLYVLELSSFQLETLHSLRTDSAVVLNISEDHMDRYDNLTDYQTVKEKIYANCELKVLNLDEPLSDKYRDEIKENWLGFTMHKPQQGQLGVLEKDTVTYLVNAKNQPATNIMDAAELKVKGRHNVANALAAIALLDSWSISDAEYEAALKSYNGLPHRCEWVREINGINFYNDSKGTNVGATVAAINGFKGALLLIAGGQGKEADFKDLAGLISRRVNIVVLFGEDADLIAQEIDNYDCHAEQDLTLIQVETLSQAVKVAFEHAQHGMNVLFSPACASFDQYQNYVERGKDFIKQVKALV